MNTLKRRPVALEVKHALGGGNDEGDVSVEVKTALANLTKSIGGRIDAIEKALATDAERKAALDAHLADLEKSILNSGGTRGGERKSMTPEERKSLELGIRALFAGNQSLAMQRFAESKSMEAGSDPAGGYLTNTTFSTEMTRIFADISPFIGLARTVELTQGTSFEEVVDKNGAECAWVGESTPAPRAETATPDLNLFRCETGELCAYPKVTQKLIDSAGINPIEWLQSKCAEGFAAKESAAFVNGDGVAKPRGYTSYPTAAQADSARPWGTIEHIATGASGAFATATTTVNPADVLIETVGALRAQYRSGALWCMNRNTAAMVRTFKDPTGRFVWVDSLVPGNPDALLGYPVIVDESLPDPAPNSLSIFFGNPSKFYTIIRRLGVRFLVDPYTQPPYVKLLAFERVGGGVHNFEAGKLVKFSNA
jgi:HK97 family phage major capsid protein